MKTLTKSSKTIVIAAAGLLGLLALLLLLVYLVFPAAFESLAATVGLASRPRVDYFPTQGWRSSTPEAQGIDSSKLADMLLAIRGKNIPVHSFLMIRNGYVVVDATFYPYDGQNVHNVASVTKSVMTTLIGIAADRNAA